MLSPQEAAAEILRRRAARTNLIDFAKYTLPSYEEAGHHHLIADHLEAVERGDIRRLMIFMPPRHGKSELASRRFPAWYMGRNPNVEIIAASYNSDLAADFGREVRSIVGAEEYQALFPGVVLRQDSKAAERWHTTGGGAYRASGVGTAMTGRGADLMLIDDPVKDREEADSELRRARVWDWYRSTAYTRLSPEGRIVVIQCMVGSTRVLMADGTEKQLKDITPGDEVLSYNHGRIVQSKVVNWANQGPDQVFTIKTKSGIIVTANERHPFLVSRSGDLEWIRLRNLRPGDKLVRPIGESGAESRAPQTDARHRPELRDSACPTTISGVGRRASGRHLSTPSRAATPTYGTGMESASLNTTSCSSNRAGGARSATSPQERMSGLIGAASCALTIATIEARSGAFCATTVTSPSATEKPNGSCSQRRDTCGITLDAIVDISAAGREDVFDIQVEATENFIANGLVSHNTRWHEDDLSGRLLEQMKADGDQWEVLSLPAMVNGEALWASRFPLERLAAIKRTIGPREWSALYMQSPQPDEGTFFQRDWLKEWAVKPADLRIYGTSDYAVTDGGGDYTVHRVWGVSATGGIYRIDGWRGQSSADVWIEKKLDLMAKHKPLAWFGEAGVIQKAVHPMLTRRMRERQVRCRLEWLSSIADKPSRARGFQARAAMGEVWFEPGADVSEFLSFPAGKHDDDVDTASMLGRALDMAHPAILKTEDPTPKKRTDYSGNRSSQGGDAWKSA